MDLPLHIVVVGAGVSGLAAAHRILELGRERGREPRLTLLEASGRPGGVISTLGREGCLIEEGPDAFFAEKPWALDFCRKLGLEEELIGTNPKFRTSFVHRHGRLYPVPGGFYLLAPSRFWPLLTSGLFSWEGKMRMLAEIFLPKRRRPGGIADESLASFVRRRLGAEALERMAQPMVAGIYSSDSEELSLRATFPKFLEWEQRYGSVIRGLMHQRSGALARAQGPRYSLFMSLKGGMESLVNRAAERLPQDSLRFGAEVRGVERSDGKFRLTGENFTLEADGLCLALPAPQASRLAGPVSPALGEELGKIGCHPGVTVNFIFPERDIPYELDGFGFVVPASERRSISGCTFASVKFPGRAPRDKAVLRAFLGREASRALLARSDWEIAQAALKDVQEILKFSAGPAASYVRRFPEGLPQYRVGHLEGVEKIERLTGEIPGFALAGNAYRGPGIPDCIKSGERAAEKIFADLS